MKVINAKDTYTNAILAKGKYGYPLWNPAPSTTPAEHYTEGVQVGDVGFLNSEGAFEYLFTIAAPKHDARNSLIKDCRFEPMQWGPGHVSTRSGFNPGDHESTESICKMPFDASVDNSITNVDTVHSGMKISCSSEGGAALLLPNGATSFNHLFLADILKHAFAHGLDWLECTRRSTLYLVTGCHKSSAWGITFSGKHSNEAGITMSLVAQDIGGGKLEYSWHNSGSTYSSRAGPGPRPKEEKDKENQCIFIRGYTIAKKTFLPSGGSTGGGGPSGGSAGGSGGAGDGAGGSAGGGGPSGVSAESSGGSQRPAHNPPSDGGPADTDSAISVEKIAGTSEPYHPSTVIIEYLFVLVTTLQVSPSTD
ncbi:hypothetical protein C8R44DRAFT_728891 [Mycena epipterygia]|nr:hypothetical protein C8R44DRAFT_728891 [Mycena epipterygia]